MVRTGDDRDDRAAAGRPAGGTDETQSAGASGETVMKPAPGLPKVTLRQIPGVQGALICMDPTTGRVLAMVGGFSYDQSQFNRATCRRCGSRAPALQKAHGLSDRA